MSRSTLTMTESLQHYLLSTGLREQSVLAELREYTSHHPFRDMQISPEQGQTDGHARQTDGRKTNH